MASLPPALFRRWVHSFEEDAGGIIVYRPADYPFPPARGRAGIEFSADGGFIEWMIGPADVPRPVAGQWRGEGMGWVSVSFPMGERPSRRFEVLECSENVLKLREG